MKLCWFNGASPALPGYRYETGERTEDANSGGYQDVLIYGAGGNSEVFEVQFHKYNDNTLIVTRNVSLPPDLLTKVKRDIQLWALSSQDCNT